MIEREGVGNSTRVKVLNYERYASGDMTHDEPVTDPCMTRDEPVTTTKEGKEGNKEKKKEDMSNKISDAWNTAMQGLSIKPVSRMTAKRRKALATRLADTHFRDDWETALLRIEDCPFLMGENDRGWKATFDWFLKPDSVMFIMEGKYDGKRKGGVGRPDQLQDKGQYDPQKLANSFSSEE